MAVLTLNSGIVMLTPGVVYDQVVGLQADQVIPSGCQLVGRGNPSLPEPIIRIPAGPNGYTFKARHDGFKFIGIRNEGGGLFVEGNNSVNTGLVVDDSEFITNIPGGAAKRCAIELSCRPVNAKITNSLFSGNAVWAVYGAAGYSGLTIANNEAINISSAFHVDSEFFSGSNGLLLEQNYGEGQIGAFMEFQHYSDHPICQDNYYCKPNVSVKNNSKFGFSLPWDKGQTPTIRRNTALAPKNSEAPAGGETTRLMFELGGKNLDFYDNYSVGGNDIAVNGTGATGKVHDNLVLDLNHFTGNNNGAICSLTNNNASVILTWDVNRGRPYRNKRYGDPVTPVGPKLLRTVQFWDDHTWKEI